MILPGALLGFVWLLGQETKLRLTPPYFSVYIFFLPKGWPLENLRDEKWKPRKKKKEFNIQHTFQPLNAQRQFTSTNHGHVIGPMCLSKGWSYIYGWSFIFLHLSRFCAPVVTPLFLESSLHKAMHAACVCMGELHMTASMTLSSIHTESNDSICSGFAKVCQAIPISWIIHLLFGYSRTHAINPLWPFQPEL